MLSSSTSGANLESVLPEIEVFLGSLQVMSRFIVPANLCTEDDTNPNAGWDSSQVVHYGSIR